MALEVYNRVAAPHRCHFCHHASSNSSLVLSRFSLNADKQWSVKPAASRFLLETALPGNYEK